MVHCLVTLFAGQAIENEQLFELYTTTGADTAWAGRLIPSRPILPVPHGSDPVQPGGKNGRSPFGAFPRRRCSRAPRPAEAPPGQAQRPRVPKPGRFPGPRRPGGYPKRVCRSLRLERPRTAGDSGGAPP
jgi:hypothetical protein